MFSLVVGNKVANVHIRQRTYNKTTLRYQVQIIQKQSIRQEIAQSQICRFTGIADPTSVPVIDKEGNEIASDELALRVTFDQCRTLLHLLFTYEQDKLRMGRSKQQSRAEVNRSKRKPWPQKGTGRARMGDRGSPLVSVGGGNSHPVRPRLWETKMPRKARQIALGTALQNAAENKDLIVVPSLHDYEATIKTRVRDGIKEDVSKGESLKALLRKWGLKDVMIDDQVTQARCLIIVSALNPKLYMSSIHLDHVAVDDIWDIKLTNILKADKIFIEAPAFKYIQRMYKDLNYTPKINRQPGHMSVRTKDFVPYDQAAQAEFADLDSEKKWPNGVNMNMVLGKVEVPEKREWSGLMSKKNTANAVWRARMVKAAMRVQKGGKDRDDQMLEQDKGEGEMDVVESQD